MMWSARWTIALAVLLAMAAVATHLGLLPPVHAALERLAARPGVSHLFEDPMTGSSDAFVALIGFTVFTPIGFFLALSLSLVIGHFVGAAIKPVMRALRLPEWGSVPIVAGAFAGAIVVSRDVWLPLALHALGSMARAYMVWAGSRPPMPQ